MVVLLYSFMLLSLSFLLFGYNGWVFFSHHHKIHRIFFSCTDQNLWYTMNIECRKLSFFWVKKNEISLNFVELFFLWYLCNKYDDGYIMNFFSYMFNTVNNIVDFYLYQPLLQKKDSRILLINFTCNWYFITYILI